MAHILAVLWSYWKVLLLCVCVLAGFISSAPVEMNSSLFWHVTWHT